MAAAVPPRARVAECALICGANPGSPVTADHSSPFRFTGTLHSVTVDVSGDLIDDRESEMRMAMARQ